MAGLRDNFAVAGRAAVGRRRAPASQPTGTAVAPIAAVATRATCSGRAATIANVPTCAELGYRGFDVAAKIGMLGAAGLPRAIVAQLQSEAAKALRTPEVVERMNTLGMQMQENGTADYEQFMREDVERYRALVKHLGIQLKD